MVGFFMYRESDDKKNEAAVAAIEEVDEEAEGAAFKGTMQKFQKGEGEDEEKETLGNPGTKTDYAK